MSAALAIPKERITQIAGFKIRGWMDFDLEILRLLDSPIYRDVQQMATLPCDQWKLSVFTDEDKMEAAWFYTRPPGEALKALGISLEGLRNAVISKAAREAFRTKCVKEITARMAITTVREISDAVCLNMFLDAAAIGAAIQRREQKSKRFWGFGK